MIPEDAQNTLILEDNQQTRHWLADCVSVAFPETRVSLAATLAEARAQLLHTAFDFAVIDLGLPDGDGSELIRQLVLADPPCYVIVATIYDDDRHLFSALRAGASGYILKDQDRERVVSYLQGIKRLQPALSAQASARMLAHFNGSAVALQQSGLTPRETEVLRLIGKGCSAEETARLLVLSPDTVKGYIKSIYAKLGVSNRSEVTLEAMRRGLVEPE